LEDLEVSAGVQNLSLISGALDSLDAANPKHQQKLKLLRNLQALDADYLILDLGAGTSFNVLDFFLVADHGVLVLLPEPTSIENAYRFVKAALYRRLLSVGDDEELNDFLSNILLAPDGTLRAPQELMFAVAERNPAWSMPLAKALDSFRIRLVVNQARGPQDAQVGLAVAGAWKRFFGLSMDYLGAIHYDDAAWMAVRKRRPLLLEKPDSVASQSLRRIADELQRLEAP
jgi:flagellar biosynthesis protein FlhG